MRTQCLVLRSLPEERARMPDIALCMELTDFYEHGIARGIVRYAKSKPDWRLYGYGWMFRPLTDLERWQGDGIIARVETSRDADRIAALGPASGGRGRGVRRPRFPPRHQRRLSHRHRGGQSPDGLRLPEFRISRCVRNATGRRSGCVAFFTGSPLPRRAVPQFSAASPGGRTRRKTGSAGRFPLRA